MCIKNEFGTYIKYTKSQMSFEESATEFAYSCAHQEETLAQDAAEFQFVAETAYSLYSLAHGDPEPLAMQLSEIVGDKTE